MRPSGGYRGDELLEARFPKRPYLLYPLLLPQTKLIIGGEAKQHKSFILHSLLWSLTTGQPAFGMSGFSVPQPVPGILFSQELTETVLQQRWERHSSMTVGTEPKNVRAMIAQGRNESVSIEDNALSTFNAPAIRRIAEPSPLIVEGAQVLIPQSPVSVLLSGTGTTADTASIPHGGYHNISPRELFLSNTYCVPKGGYGLDSDRKRQAIWEHVVYFNQVYKRQPAWIALDPISKFHSKQENKQEEVAQVLGVIDEIQLRTGAGVIFCHHHGVMTQDKATYRSGGGLLRGSSQWHADVDVILTVKKSKTLEHAINIELRHEEEMQDFVVKLNKQSLLFEFTRWAKAPDLNEDRKELT